MNARPKRNRSRWFQKTPPPVREDAEQSDPAEEDLETQKMGQIIRKYNEKRKLYEVEKMTKMMEMEFSEEAFAKMEKRSTKPGRKCRNG